MPHSASSDVPPVIIRAEIINLTAEDVHFVSGEYNQNRITFPVSGIIAKVEEIMNEVGKLNGGIPLYETIYGDVVNLPEPSQGVVFIVSTLVALIAERDDLVVCSNHVYNSNGVIIGCKGFTHTHDGMHEEEDATPE